MKRIHLFEFEDLNWFPNWIRELMTHYLNAVHKVFGSAELISNLLAELLQKTNQTEVLDMCSGSGGAMPSVQKVLSEKHGIDVKLHLSDLYPNLEAAKGFNQSSKSNLEYITTSINAAQVEQHQKIARTMICSLHHMKPDVAKSILKSAKEDHVPFLAFEISDNSVPLFIAWIAIPIGFIMTLFITPFVRPMSWKQIVFTYFAPILPLLIGWDGGISNMRTYTSSDMDILLEGLTDDSYEWKTGALDGKGGKKLYVMGIPK